MSGMPNITHDQAPVLTPPEALLSQHVYRVADLPALLSPAMLDYLPQLAAKSQQLSRRHFGSNLQLFMPLYLSNLCTNVCTYCGFSAEAKLKRTWLRPAEILREIESIKSRGVAHLLLVSGEAEHRIDCDYFVEVIKTLRPHFANLQIESQPFSEEGYEALVGAGLNGVVVYQETYNRERYAEVHRRGKKADYDWRLQTAARAASANIEKIGLGILLGLGPWREDALALAEHLAYLQQHYWRQRYSVSFPRMRPCASRFNVQHPVSDREFIQMIIAFRLCFPTVDIVLSTRESPALRDLLLPLGITHLSAESSTQPGGYTPESRDALEQFSTGDQRSLEQVCARIRELDYQPVLADQIPGAQLT